MSALVKEGNSQLQHLLISIRLPDGHWAGDSTRENHHVTLRIEEHMPLPGGRGSARAIAFGLDVENFLETVKQHRGVEEITIYESNSDTIEMNVSIAKAGGGFLRPLMKANVVPRTPFQVRDGWVDWDFVTDIEHLRRLMAALKETKIPHKVHSFSKEESPRLLTPRQREVFDHAVRLGYYDNPRRITLTNLAKKIGVSKSTLCEMIHLIEKNMVEKFADQVREQSPQE